MQGFACCGHLNFSYSQREIKTRTPSKAALRSSGRNGMRRPQIPFAPLIDLRCEVEG
jgi:hypothetical protein